ncbi:S-adenosyl-L-methionine-dependent methyltransferase [Truncatella angustata]|uniref:S-adenosyl-L-methionine-dependent methyltransferase n=1 Tax=Truncatella angustata TaxID=152316 RepID=A0A9P8UUT0_9PEZI|nr:S-adenosyl-L-methionine-dependent methyltransferase [Truncatella angustata]KAH6658901.1 S-adenosyl-L-methionine-dependent methyltransferase [Truncatella angustata]
MDRTPPPRRQGGNSWRPATSATGGSENVTYKRTWPAPRLEFSSSPPNLSQVQSTIVQHSPAEQRDYKSNRIDTPPDSISLTTSHEENFWDGSDTEGSDEAGGVRIQSKDSAVGATRTGLVQSLARRFRKRFHKRNVLPLDKQELERHDWQHEIMCAVHGGRLHLAPILRPRKVLDIGTGTGKWAVEFAKVNPNTSVLGIDLNPVTTTELPLNCHLLVADALQEWKFGNMFDFIHVRNLGDFSPERRYLIEPIFQHLAPGGWVQFQEWVYSFKSGNHSLNGTTLKEYSDLLVRGTRQLRGGRNRSIVSFKSRMEIAGFQSITERKYPVPINPWPPKGKSKRLGAMMMQNMLQVVEPLSFATLVGGLGWSPEALDSYVSRVRDDLQNTDIHGYLILLTVYGQKPTVSSGSRC